MRLPASFEGPAALGGFPACFFFKAGIGFEAGLDEGEALVSGAVAGELLVEVAAVVVAVLGDEVGFRDIHADGVVGELLEAFAAFEPAGGAVVGAGVLVEVALVLLAAAHEEGNAAVGAGQHEHGVAGFEAVQAVAAQAVAEQDGVVLAGGHGVDALLQILGHGLAAEVMEALGHKLDVDLVGRAGQFRAHLAEEHFATDQFEAHAALLVATRARMKSGFVPQQPPRKEAPASMSTG